MISSILFFSLVVKNTINGEENQERKIAKFGCFAIFLVLGLKKYTVGIDIIGYYRQYLISARMPWDDVDYVYFEDGYVQFMKLFSKMDLHFKYFMMIVYAILCIALYLFIRKFSKNATLSLLIFICYQFFVFSVSGVRQTLAMAICMFSYILFDRKNKWRIVGSVALAFVATEFHQSSWVFFAVFIILLFKSKHINIVFYIVGMLFSFVLRPYFLQFILEYFERDMTETEVTLGGAFIFLVLIAIFVWAMVTFQPDSDESNEEATINHISSRVLLVSAVSYIALSGSSLLRGTMYLNLFMIPGIPNSIKLLKVKSDQDILNLLMSIFLIVLFYVDTLAPNQLELCPYVFYWQ